MTYYWDVVNYAQTSGDYEALQYLSSPGCSGCTGGYRGIKETYERDGKITGGEFSTSKVSVVEAGASVVTFSATYELSQADQVTIFPSGAKKVDTYTGPATMVLSFVGNAWQVIDLGFTR